jgi:mannan endo-1,4-beta-mannosidase
MKFPKYLTAAVAVAALAACGTTVSEPAASPSPTSPPPAAVSGHPGSVMGVFETNSAASFGLVPQFGTATGRRPDVVADYSGWWVPFPTALAADDHAYGAVPLIQLDPNGVTMSHIAAGWYDKYLKTYAAAVKAYGHPVILSFAHEMNGGWYQWGNGHTPAATWVAAWKHIVDVFRAQGAANVTWLWTVNSTNATRASLKQWWPGAGYVNWVGVDGYYYRKTDTYQSVFGSTVAQIRKFTSAPVLIAETAVGPVAGPSKIKGLFAGAATDDLLGIVWFDQAQHDGIYHQDWRLEDSPAALAAFKSAVTGDAEATATPSVSAS